MKSQRTTTVIGICVSHDLEQKISELAQKENLKPSQ